MHGGGETNLIHLLIRSRTGNLPPVIGKKLKFLDAEPGVHSLRTSPPRLRRRDAPGTAKPVINPAKAA